MNHKKAEVPYSGLRRIYKGLQDKMRIIRISSDGEVLEKINGIYERLQCPRNGYGCSIYCDLFVDIEEVSDCAYVLRCYEDICCILEDRRLKNENQI